MRTKSVFIGQKDIIIRPGARRPWKVVYKSRFPEPEVNEAFEAKLRRYRERGQHVIVVTRHCTASDGARAWYDRAKVIVDGHSENWWFGPKYMTRNGWKYTWHKS